MSRCLRGTFRKRRESGSGLVAAAVVLATVSCSPPAGDTVEVTGTRPATDRDRQIKVGATVEERFSDVFQPRQQPGMPGAGDSSGLDGAFAWTTPEGWEEKPSQGAFRLANFSFGPDGEGECYFGVLGGAGGGLLANINRWRSQMGLPPVAESDLDGLPERPFFRRMATYVDIEGTFTGISGSPEPGFRMLGLIHSGPQFTLFAKMTGPADLVEEQAGNFEGFAGSLGLAGNPGAEGGGE